MVTFELPIEGSMLSLLRLTGKPEVFARGSRRYVQVAIRHGL